MSQQLELYLQLACDADGLPSEAQLERWARAALQASTSHAEVTVRVVDAAEGQMLNRDYRGRDYATNVLTFTFDDDAPLLPGLPLMGDLVFCAPVVAREAQEQGISLEAHYAHLTVHGMLHLQGFDHLDDAEAEAMEALETAILAQLGYADPYAGEKD